HPNVWRFYDTASETVREGVATAAISEWRKATAGVADPAAVARIAEELAPKLEGADPRSPFWIRNRADEKVLPEPGRSALAKLEGELEGLKKSPPAPLEYANGAQEGGC